MRAVVVGGLGFLGGAVTEELLVRGDRVDVIEPRDSQRECDDRFGDGRVRAWRGDILDPQSLGAAFAGADEVYNFAGRLGTSELDDDVLGAISCNIVGAVNVFQTAAAAGAPTVFHASKPNVWLNAYSITKSAADDFARLYAARDGVRIRSLRYFNVYGPRQARGPVRKIIPSFAAQAWRGEPITVYGDGTQTVDMIYSGDLARITVEFTRARECKTGSASTPIAVCDCGRGIAITVNEVAAAVNAITGNPSGVEHVPMRRGEDAGTTIVAEMAPLRAAIGEPRFAEWQQSLRSTVEWYRCNISS